MRIQLKKIICTTDFSELSNSAISYGITLAREFKAKLYLCHVIDLSTATMYGESTLAFETQNEYMEVYAHNQINKIMSDQNVEWEPIVTIGRTPEEIARAAEENNVDLVITATRGRTGIKRLVFGSVTTNLMRMISCPLLVVKGAEHDIVSLMEQGSIFKKILVGCDFSPDSIKAYNYALSLAQEFQSELHLAHVMPPPEYKDMPESIKSTGAKLAQDVRIELKERLDKLVSPEVRNWCSPKTTLLAGDPHEEIVKYAFIEHMDLIVMGVRGYSLMEKLFVGSTTVRVLLKTSCPVLCIRDTTSEND